MSRKKSPNPAEQLSKLYADWWIRFLERWNTPVHERLQRVLQLGEWAFGARMFAVTMETGTEALTCWDVYRRWEELENACRSEIRAEMEAE